VAFAPAAAGASTILTIGDDYYLGSITDGIPPSPENEVEYINYLITLGPGQGDTQIPAGTGEIYNREDSDLVGPFPTAIEDGAAKDESGGFQGIDGTGYTYILGKYDAEKAGTLVWVISGLADASDIDLPELYNGHELSHWSLYNGDSGTTVPDGGAAITLLGLAMLGIGCARRYLA
jgi:hypothetical protein